MGSPQQYLVFSYTGRMTGSDVLVAAVVTPAGESGLVEASFWLLALNLFFIHLEYQLGLNYRHHQLGKIFSLLEIILNVWSLSLAHYQKLATQNSPGPVAKETEYRLMTVLIILRCQIKVQNSGRK